MRQAGVDDLEALFAIQRAAALAGYANVFPAELYPFPDDAVHEQLRVQLAEPDVVAIVDDEGRGYVLVRPGWLERLYVHPDAWGSGVGGRLHDEGLAALRKMGSTVASLWVLTENVRARAFYERRGWRLNGEEREVPFPPYPIDVSYSIDL
jgi:GNAT superfamily N-acetyltransferase